MPESVNRKSTVSKRKRVSESEGPVTKGEPVPDSTTSSKPPNTGKGEALSAKIESETSRFPNMADAMLTSLNMQQPADSSTSPDRPTNNSSPA